MQYIEADKRQRKKNACIFCSLIKKAEDENSLVIYADNATAAILNRFPYNNGHLMVMPRRHVAELEQLTEKEVLKLHETTSKCIRALKETMAPHGFNVGINMGKTAGAGVPDHIHVHVVPRWNGDTNFMPVVASTKVMPQHLIDTSKKLKKALKNPKARKRG